MKRKFLMTMMLSRRKAAAHHPARTPQIDTFSQVGMYKDLYTLGLPLVVHTTAMEKAICPPSDCWWWMAVSLGEPYSVSTWLIFAKIPSDFAPTLEVGPVELS